MQFVADPGFLVALAVLLGADIARGGQIGEHLIEVLRGLPFEARRLGFWPFLVLARASALARRLSAIGRRRILLFVVRLRLDRLLARLDLGGVARDHADDAPAERALDQRRVHLVGQIALRKLREGAGKGSFRWHLRASFLTENATQRPVDIEALDQSGGGRNAQHRLGDESPGARARRSSGGRPAPRGGSGTKASRPITSRVVTSRPSASVIGSTSSRSQGNR